MNQIVFELNQITKSYKSNLVLKNMTCAYSFSQFVALIGRNGAGKSTLMRLLAKQELPDSGQITFMGKDICEAKTEINPELLFISEQQSLMVNISLQKWLVIYADIYAQYDHSLAVRLASELGVDLKKSFMQLSRGQKMKALFCLGAGKRPRVYILDEITSVLDSGSRWHLMRFLLHERERGCLIIMSTNITSELQGFATDVVFVEQGEIEFSSRVDRFADHFIKLKLSAAELSSVLVQKVFLVKTHHNLDGTWSCIATKEACKDLPSNLFDRREITVEDVASYFTSWERER